MKKRGFLRAAGGTTAAAAAAAGIAAAREGGGGTQVQPDFDDYLGGVDGGYEDLRDQDEITIKVGASDNEGNLTFTPAGIWVNPSTTVTQEQTSEGGGHNVVVDEGASLDSGAAVSEAGSTYKYTSENGGIAKYHCMPHEAPGILGAVAVGDDVAIVSTGGGDEKELHELGVPIQAHWVGSAAILGILVTIIYTFFILKYDESPNTGNTGGGE